MFARDGAIVVADLSSDDVNETADLIGRAGGEAKAEVTDISKPVCASALGSALERPRFLRWLNVGHDDIL